MPSGSCAGLVIFNIDRWLVTSLQRGGGILATVGAFLPRFILAVLLGMVISEPLVLRLFRPEIEAELPRMQAEAAAEHTRGLAEDPRYSQIPTLQKRVDELQAIVDGTADNAGVLEDPEVKDLSDQLTAKETELASAEAAVICEHEGTCGSEAR